MRSSFGLKNISLVERVLDELAVKEEARAVRHAPRLLHVVRDDDDSIALLELVEEGLDLGRGDRVEGARRLVHEEDVGLDGEDPGDAEPLLLAAREAQRGLVEPVLDLVEEGRVDEAPLHELVEARRLSARVRARSPCTRGP